MFKTVTTIAVSAIALFAVLAAPLANAEAANLEAAQYADGVRMKRNLRVDKPAPYSSCCMRRASATAVEALEGAQALEGVEALEAVEYADAANAMRPR